MAADTRWVDGSGPDEVRELASLEAQEARISAERRRLHNQIDYGFATEATHAREREVSAERRQLHQRIDSLRESLRAQGLLTADEEPTTPLSPLSQWPGVSGGLLAIDDVSGEDAEL